MRNTVLQYPLRPKNHLPRRSLRPCRLNTTHNLSKTERSTNIASNVDPREATPSLAKKTRIRTAGPRSRRQRMTSERLLSIGCAVLLCARTCGIGRRRQAGREAAAKLRVRNKRQGLLAFTLIRKSNNRVHHVTAITEFTASAAACLRACLPVLSLSLSLLSRRLRESHRSRRRGHQTPRVPLPLGDGVCELVERIAQLSLRKQPAAVCRRLQGATHHSNNSSSSGRAAPRAMSCPIDQKGK